MTPRHPVPEPRIRPLEPGDVDAVCALSLRAWEPVFSSFRRVLGERVYLLLYPDWQVSQAAAVRRNCLDAATSALVVEHDGEVAGFAVLVRQDDPPMGVVDMIAVDPAHQRQGLGRRLVDAAVAQFAAAGLRLVNIGTGGDPGHAPARAVRVGRLRATTARQLLPRDRDRPDHRDGPGDRDGLGTSSPRKRAGRPARFRGTSRSSATG